MNDLIKIKKYYGEQMMHLCRVLFPTILEQDNLLFNLLERNFANSKFLYEDIINNKQEKNFKKYIYSLLDIEEESPEVTKSPKELLEEAGYILYECHTESDIQQFKKYYSKGEALCTFNGGRLKDCHVFFAVKKNVDVIKRENFSYPQRQDEYGTSVISIQFSKGNINTLSIKNRYNHKVINPDATFGNNLENIIPGLTRAFEKEYKLKINQNSSYDFELPDYIIANDGKYYKYNYEINNVYYCPNNTIIDNFEVKKYEPEKYLVIDYFILDLVNKKIYLYDDDEEDSFINGLQSIKKIEIIKKNQLKTIKIIFKDNNEAYIEIDNHNRIISYKNDNLIEVEQCFLILSKKVQKIELLNAQKIYIMNF